MSAFLPPLTDRQRETYQHILYCCAQGYPPSVRELMVALNVASPNGVNALVDPLIRKGYVVNNGKARGLRPATSPVMLLVVAAMKAERVLREIGRTDEADSLTDALQPFERRAKHGAAKVH